MKQRRTFIGRMLRWVAGGLCLAACVAHGQIVTPPLQVPELPAPIGGVTRTVEGVVRDTQEQALREARRLRVRTLLRANRGALEADPRGALMIRNEVVALSPSQEALDRARAAGFTVGRTRTLEGLDTTIVVLAAPPGMSTRRALQRLRAADPEGVYDFNHVYLESGRVAPNATPTSTAAAARAASGGVKVGLIDGGVQRSHSVFRDVVVHEFGCAGSTVPSAHGTAVASLIAGEANEFRGAAPGAQLYAADVYCGLPTGGALDAIADAFAWMSRERVPVINVSLVGPANALLERIVRAMTIRGHLIVAAVGNDGPSAPPLYPAAYPDVVAVTGVDARERALVEACRGKHVDFAAPGANMTAANVATPFGAVRGTSFAAPIVSGLLARELTTLDRAHAQAALAKLVAVARDLGASGRDKIYGDGLVGDSVRPPETLAAKK